MNIELAVVWLQPLAMCAPPTGATAVLILKLLWQQWATTPISYDARLLWAACCLGFFGFMRIGEFTTRSPRDTPRNIIAIHDVDRASGYPPEYIRVHLRQSKTDPYATGVYIFLGKTGTTICPVAALLSFLTVRPRHARYSGTAMGQP